MNDTPRTDDAIRRVIDAGESLDAGSMPLIEAARRMERELAEANWRLERMRLWMSSADWHLFCRAHPYAEDWFDSDGLPK